MNKMYSLIGCVFVTCFSLQGMESTEHSDQIIPLTDLKEKKKSFVLKPSFAYSEKFINIKQEEVDPILNSLIDDLKAPNSGKIKTLRQIINDYAIKEELVHGHIYLECPLEKALQFKEKIGALDIISEITIFDTNDENYKKVVSELKWRKVRTVAFYGAGVTLFATIIGLGVAAGITLS